jgi:hypothetical protein
VITGLFEQAPPGKDKLRVGKRRGIEGHPVAFFCQIRPAFYQPAITQKPQALPMAGLYGKSSLHQWAYPAASAIDDVGGPGQARPQWRTVRQDLQACFKLLLRLFRPVQSEERISVSEPSTRIVRQHAHDIPVKRDGVPPDVVMSDAKN